MDKSVIFPVKKVSVNITADTSHLSCKDIEALGPLSQVVKIINKIYCDQMGQNLKETQGVFDKSRSKAFYPKGITAELLEKYLNMRGGQSEEIRSPYTIIRWKGSCLEAIPYSVYYKDLLNNASALLRKASSITRNSSMKKFLKSRSYAFGSDHYWESDEDWINIKGCDFELTVGPYENYEDDLLGVKCDFEAILGIIDHKEQEMVSRFEDFVRPFDEYMGKHYGYAPSSGIAPMTVINAICCGGGAYYGYVPMAYNLPNGNDFHEIHGSKKVFLKNIMSAKVENITLPIIRKVLGSEHHSITEDVDYLKNVIAHELSHGLGIRLNSPNFKELGSALEEGKADVFGSLFLYFVADKQDAQVKGSDVGKMIILHLVDHLRQLRFGFKEAHALGALFQYQWLKRRGALFIEDGFLKFREECFEEAFNTLADRLVLLSESDSYEDAKTFLDEYGVPINGLDTLLQKIKDLPVDIEPKFSW